MKLERPIIQGVLLNCEDVLGMMINGYVLYETSSQSKKNVLTYVTTGSTFLPTFNSDFVFESKTLYNDECDDPIWYAGNRTVKILSNDAPNSIKLNNRNGLINVDFRRFDTSNITTAKNLFCFDYAPSLVDTLIEVKLPNNFITNNITDTSRMFYNCHSLFSSLDASDWDTSNVTNMSEMFYLCDKLPSIGDISNWDTGNVTDMSYMFFNCDGITSLDLSNWNTSNVTDMGGMFENCSNLTTLDISNWDTSNVTNMYAMFNSCPKLHTLRLDNCSKATISKIIDSQDFPTDAIDGVTRIIYCKEANAEGLTAPTNWVFSYV